MKMYTAENVDDYIKNADERARPILKSLREIIKTTIPDADEKISWGVPFYYYFGPLAGFSTQKNHVDFGFYNYWTDQDRAAFEKAGYTTGSKIVRINFDQKVPTEIIARIVKDRAKLNAAKKTK